MPIAQGHRWTIFTQLVFRTYGDVCIVCGHGGARCVDHVISRTERPDLTFELSNCRPIHGAPGNPCPVCTAQADRKIHCNQIKSGMTLERAKRKVAEIVAAGEKAKTPLKRKKPGPSAEDPGRVW